MPKIPQTTEDKIEVATQLKNEGNDHFKKQDYKKAINTYKKVFLYINGLNSNLSSVMGGDTTKKELPEVEKLRVVVNMNISFCYFKLENIPKAYEHIQKTCQIEPENMKARYRRGQIQMMRGDLDNAKVDLEAAQKAFPNDSAIQNDLKVLQGKFVQFEKKEKQMFKKMFE